MINTQLTNIILSKTYDPMYQKGYTKEKMQLATGLAKKLDMPQDELDKLKIAMLLYDIGNVMLPEEILQKPGPLDKKEKEKIDQHPIYAAKKILKPISNITDVIPIIKHHHENWDGTGYPSNISGKDIPLSSQIVLIVDAFFALTSDRPYRQALEVEAALDVIKQDANKKFSPELVTDFIELVREKQDE